MSHPLVVHCKIDRYDVYIGRGSPWGNPFTHQPLSKTKALVQVASREESIEEFRKWFIGQPEMVRRAKDELRGRVLGCFCAPMPCHGDVLASIANEEDPDLPM